MAADLRRMVALGPAGSISPGGAQDLRALDNRRFFRETATRWVRMWADWPSLEPARGQIDAVHLQALDAQIVQARRDGLRVILTPYRFPTWANGMDALTAAQLAATMPDRRTAAQPDTSAKSLLLRYPDDVSQDSDWGRFIDLLASRYSRANLSRPSLEAVVDVLEIVNEANLAWWPQVGPSTTSNPFGPGPIIAHQVVQRMFATAQAIVGRYGGEPMLAGPGSADVTDSNRLRTGYASFAIRVLAALGTAGFVAGAGFVWTHHNYSDVTYDLGPGSTAPDAATDPTRQVNRTADMRRRLVGAWAGWPSGSSADPGLFLTEGGVTARNLTVSWGLTDPAAVRAKQVELLRRNWARMSTGPEGAGVGMICNYLWYTDPNFDSGLCDTPDAGGATRPAYDAWGALPAFA
jgi:hypothetical protein